MKYLFVLFVVLCSCQNTRKDEITLLIKEWEGKEIIFPSNLEFTIQGMSNVKPLDENSDYKIVTYVDSMGCTSCKLRLLLWKKLISEIDSLSQSSVSFYFFFYPKKRTELYSILRRDDFNYPVCIDDKDTFNKLNHIPKNDQFQTFLLDKKNKVIAIGNPTNNLKLKDLYIKIIKGLALDNEEKVIKTKVNIDESTVSLGNFDWQKEQRVTFSLKNTGNELLVIEGVNTSCGCTTVEFEKEPIRSGGSLDLHIMYKADHPEHFSKTITVYCNAESSPIKLTISGNAQ